MPLRCNLRFATKRAARFVQAHSTRGDTPWPYLGQTTARTVAGSVSAKGDLRLRCTGQNTGGGERGIEHSHLAQEVTIERQNRCRGRTLKRLVDHTGWVRRDITSFHAEW